MLTQPPANMQQAAIEPKPYQPNPATTPVTDTPVENVQQPVIDRQAEQARIAQEIARKAERERLAEQEQSNLLEDRQAEQARLAKANARKAEQAQLAKERARKAEQARRTAQELERKAAQERYALQEIERKAKQERKAEQAIERQVEQARQAEREQIEREIRAQVAKERAAAAKAVPVANQEKPASADHSRYMIQCAALRSQESAESLKARIAFSSGLSSSLQVANSANGTVYKVMVGPFKGKDAVSDASGTLQGAGINGCIVKRG
ncbi:MAG: SPOR domain-containing protein [Aeromonas sp.]